MISNETIIALEFDRVRMIAASLAASSLGSERLGSMQPCATLADAERLSLLTAELSALLTAHEFPIHGLLDIRAELQRASVAGAALEPEALFAIALTARAGVSVRTFLAQKKTQAPLLNEIAKVIGPLAPLADKIERAIAPEGDILDDASSRLKGIRQDKRKEQRDLERRMSGILQKWSDLGILQDAVVSYREGRLALPVKDEYRHRVQGVLVDTSASGSTVFVEPVETLEISNRLRQLEQDEKREIHKILLELTALVHAQHAELVSLLDVMSELDELYGRARLALRWECTPVTLNDRGLIRVLRGRHPLLLERLKQRVVPLSLELLPPLRTVVISGPNAGGKTVVLKTVGLFSLMAAAGLLLPAAPGSEVAFFRAIHADIGDAQSIESDLSTFTAHVGRLGRMLAETASPKLVLIDEIGSSTDPALGSALAQAVLLALTHQSAVSLVTTHHGSLKAFAHEAAGMENGSMTFDEASLEPTYVYRPGIPGSSYAFEIAERVGFPAAILETARSFIGTGQLGLEELVSELSKKLEAYEKLRRESDLKLNEYEALKKLYAEKTKELKKIQADVKARALAEAEAIIEKTGRDMEAAIREIKKEQASKHAIHEARERIIKAATDVSKRQAAIKQELAPETPARQRVTAVKPGDRVELDNIPGEGRVLGLQKNGQRVEIEIGGVRMWVDVSRLYAATEAKAAPRRVSMQVELSRKEVPLQLDLRGKYGDEAIPEVDSYLAAAADANVKVVTIVHGKGTGALRVKVREFLDAHPLVKGYRDGGRENNDFGSTVVELRS